METTIKTWQNWKEEMRLHKEAAVKQGSALKAEDPTEKGEVTAPSCHDAENRSNINLPSNPTSNTTQTKDGTHGLCTVTEPNGVGEGSYPTAIDGDAKDKAYTTPATPLGKIAADLKASSDFSIPGNIAGDADIMSKLAYVGGLVTADERGRQLVDDLITKQAGRSDAQAILNEVSATMNKEAQANNMINQVNNMYNPLVKAAAPVQFKRKVGEAINRERSGANALQALAQGAPVPTTTVVPEIAPAVTNAPVILDGGAGIALPGLQDGAGDAGLPGVVGGLGDPRQALTMIGGSAQDMLDPSLVTVGGNFGNAALKEGLGFNRQQSMYLNGSGVSDDALPQDASATGEGLVSTGVVREPDKKPLSMGGDPGLGEVAETIDDRTTIDDATKAQYKNNLWEQLVKLFKKYKDQIGDNITRAGGFGNYMLGNSQTLGGLPRWLIAALGAGGLGALGYGAHSLLSGDEEDEKKKKVKSAAFQKAASACELSHKAWMDSFEYPFEKMAYMQGAVDGEAMANGAEDPAAQAAMGGEAIPADDTQFSDEEIMQAIQALYESGQVSEDQVAALLQQLQGDQIPAYTAADLAMMLQSDVQSGQLDPAVADQIANEISAMVQSGQLPAGQLPEEQAAPDQAGMEVQASVNRTADLFNSML